MKYLFVSLNKFFFQGYDDAVKVVDVAGKMLRGQEFTGCDQWAAFSGDPVGQAYFKTDDIFSRGDRVIGNEHLFDLSGMNIILPGEQAVFKVLVHISIFNGLLEMYELFFSCDYDVKLELILFQIHSCVAMGWAEALCWQGFHVKGCDKTSVCREE